MDSLDLVTNACHAKWARVKNCLPALVILSGGAGAAAVLLGEKCRRRIQRGQ